jgi:chorismate mutase
MPDKGTDILAARGAICLAADTAGLVDEATAKLMSALAEANGIDPSDCIFVIFSVTGDIRSRNPATAARAAGWKAPLFCVREAEFDESPSLVLRVLLAFRCAPGTEARHVYLDGAEKLRPDLFPGSFGIANASS